MHCEPFKGRFLIIDARNRTESVMLRMKEYGPTPASAMGGGHSPCRTRNSAEGETCTVYDLEAVAAWAFLSFFINHVVGLMGLYDTPPMPPYAGLIPYPAWDGDDYTDLNALAMEPYVDEDPMQYDYDEEEYYSSDEYDSDDDDDLVD
ncbi:hypothetical protein TARUN_6716 [Trichoderma arundinaceum]|uniref:Uncharacterized protein n=1 Tax=Trichoderma arundinaceum TaxID=490622 RepID=A0A395NHS4_TRIAR|nr:hypothetical protein TARUN_6716 [Trichoderma arundinaceum]